MKKTFLYIIDYFFSKFKFYRYYRGGIWILIFHKFPPYPEFWEYYEKDTNLMIIGGTILKKESYLWKEDLKNNPQKYLTSVNRIQRKLAKKQIKKLSIKNN